VSLVEAAPVKKVAGGACASDEIARLVFNISTTPVNPRTIRDRKNLRPVNADEKKLTPTGEGAHGDENYLLARGSARKSVELERTCAIKYESFR
jgi:hypothetical protein